MIALLAGPLSADNAPFVSLESRTNAAVAALNPAALITGEAAGEWRLEKGHWKFAACAAYPYHEQFDSRVATTTLVEDLSQGLDTGLRCLAGLGESGRLHPFHEYQANRLLKLLEAEPTKNVRCVEDSMFATAVASSPVDTPYDDPLARELSKVEHPAIVIDTFRFAGILSQRHDDQTYRDFFHLSDSQIAEHRRGRAIRSAGLHRTSDRPALLFHEMVHWLGHEHSAIYPDLAVLYEICCFGGSEYIDDPENDRRHQQTACRILKDDELWQHAYNPYKAMRLWHFKGYDQFKTQMRKDYSG